MTSLVLIGPITGPICYFTSATNESRSV